MKEAYLVVGPEKSGTRFFTKQLVAAGCFGDGKHIQKVDALLKKGKLDQDKVVIRRSMPHAGHYIDLKAIIEKLREIGYGVRAYVTNRDYFCMFNSQVKSYDDVTGENVFMRNYIAYNRIFKYLFKCSVPFYMVNYEGIVLRGYDYINKMLDLFELGPVPEDKEELIYDGNEKYYKKTKEEKNDYLAHWQALQR